MAKFSEKFKGKEVGQAAVYAAPHTSVKACSCEDPNTVKAGDMKPGRPVPRVSMGDPAANDIKTTGIKIRGTGAATKGVMARGPMG